MGIFPEFGGWISQNTQQPKESENVKSKPVRETKTHDERDETREQLKLWRDANKKKQYNEPSPTVKVHTDPNIDSFSNMEMEFTLRLPPQAAYDFLTNHDNKTYSREINGRPLLERSQYVYMSSKSQKNFLHITGKVEKEWTTWKRSGLTTQWSQYMLMQNACASTRSRRVLKNTENVVVEKD
ncbi:uncharacterized protein LOC108814224 isoform X2 [Raphanus sativus]|uniref:Uncharacterized protein LOC108814224 isoform X2 n=1 Tax=Raphanus sativus TaxID=3726 RepID=A0A9W3C400_RAPSA|nr:uncharacterized protein LOC108814224 isoform X2 [Raphanus sativus]